jgi:phage repressor protein C with HTH and peptisase S24 domain
LWIVAKTRAGERGSPVADDVNSDEMAAFIDRLARALGETPQAQIARKAGVSTSVMTRYMNGSEPSLFRAARLAEALGVSLQWLATGQGQPNAAAGGFASVPIYDVRLAAGAASFSDGAQKIGDMPIDYELLRSMGRSNAEGLAAMVFEGDSMEPTIADGARGVIDTKDTRLREGIFAFRMGDELRAKRLHRWADGVEIISDNPRYDPERLSGHQLDQFAIIGRVLLAVTLI